MVGLIHATAVVLIGVWMAKHGSYPGFAFALVKGSK
jgi:hypothetical protein